MKNILFLILILLSLGLVSAIEISTTYDSDVIIKEFMNPVEITLKVTEATPGTYNLFTLADLEIEPSATFTIDDDEFTKSFTLIPTENLKTEGYYSFSYTLNHRGVEKIDKKFKVEILPLSKILEIESDSIDPESGEVSFFVTNTKNVEIKDLKARFSSILFSIEKEINLEPNERIEIPVEVDPQKLSTTKAGVYLITTEFQTPIGKVIDEGNLYLGEKKNIETDIDKGGLIIQSASVTKVNTGNTVESVQINIEKNIISRLFTSFNSEPTYIQRDGGIITYTWIKERLQPGDSLKVTAKTNFTLPFLAIIFIVLAYLGFKRFGESKIDLIKSVKHVKTKKEEFALRITLSLKVKKNVSNLSIIDKVPAIVKIYNKFGIVRPDKIDAANRRMHWNVGNVGPGEERTFTYIVYSKVGVVGKFSLPSAAAIFEKEGQVHEVESNKVFFLSDQISG